MQHPDIPELSIVVPVLNEVDAVRPLLQMLAVQEGVSMELFLCDGGSCDGTIAAAAVAAEQYHLQLTIMPCNAGRGRQMNAGAGSARAKTLLFLHVDSLFRDPRALRGGLDRLDAAITARGDDRVAGRFGLRFNRTTTGGERGYHFYECKARLDRPGCIHGDQGFLLRRSLFEALGSFPESPSMLAETRFAGTVQHKASWLLLPAEIHTSARRFEDEGLAVRQTLNAVIMSLAATGHDRMLAELPGLYRSRGEGSETGLHPVLQAISAWIAAMPPVERTAFWRATGSYVRDNAWQLAFALDTRRRFRRGLPPEAEPAVLAFYDRWLDRLTDHAVGRQAAAWLTRLWFRYALRHSG
jgi:hypothetical protein